MSRYIITDANWRETGERPRGWIVVINQQHRDSNAALVDRPQPTTFFDAASLVLAKLGVML